MLYELNVKSFNDLESVKQFMGTIKKGGKILVIKNAINIFSLREWEIFIKNKLELTQDKRHYDINENLIISNWWQIVYDPARDHSYTHSKTTQPFHNDNSWFSNPAEINFFYMEKQASCGGENLFYPLYRLLDDLMKDEPELLNDLIHTGVTIKKGTQYSNKTTIISNDDNKIFWNYYRTVKENNQIKKMCDSFFSFLKTKENSKSIINYRVKTGDLFCFNDLSMLHGRLAFQANLKGDRSLFQSMWRI
tara:strand:- start:1130 stop:1876 length:747 start_codon:yes stop_codon:yes gene_type:complete